MTLDNIVEYLILGIITGGFATFAPVMIGYAYDVILKIFRMSSD